MSIGTDIPRVDGLAKLSGRAAYVDDLVIPDVLHAGTVRSPIARGRIRRICFDPSIDWSEFVIVDHRDIPGPNQVRLIELDQPALAASEFRHRYEAVALLAHPSIRKLRQALRAVRIDVDPLPAVTDPRRPLAPGLIQYRADNVFKRIDIRKGDPTAQFASSAHVVEGTYHTGAQEHVYLETQGMVAYHEHGRLVVQGSMQCPYYVLDALTHLFGRPRDAFRVVPTTVGGGFGGKEEFPSLVAIHAALLAEKAGRPVKLIYDRQEDMLATTKRHPAWVHHRTALDRDGHFLAMEIDVLLDGGAYMTLSPVVLSRGAIHAAGPYHCDHVHVHGEARLSNVTPYGAFRGFGAPQTIFAMERHIDEIGRRIGIDPIELRRRNLLEDGQTTATGQVIRDGVDRNALMQRALDDAEWSKRNDEHRQLNATHPYLRRGMGCATFHHGAGFTGAGETYLASEVQVAGLPDGKVEVLSAQTDIGQGTNTILAQVAADALALPADAVRVAQADTSRVPNSGPTVASRTAMIVGRLVEEACADLVRLATESDLDPRGADLRDAIRRWHAAHPGASLTGRAKYITPASIRWDEETYRGDAYACFAWACYVAEVEVDLRTCSVRVVDFIARQEIGRVLNPTLARGQIQGGVAQGIGWALYEEVKLSDGGMANAQMTNYVIPTAGDLPEIRVAFEEQRSPFGPGGAKGIGELPMDGPAPAIVNAVCAALDLSVFDVPLTPERLMELLAKTK